MKVLRSLITIVMLAMATFLHAQTKWVIDPNHSHLGFNITNMVINKVHGRFDDFQISFTATKDDFSDAVVELTAKVASINTGVEKRDNHLRTDDFFDVEKYPTLYFRSTQIEMTGTGKAKLHGDLTMHGITKPVVVEVEHRGTILNPNTNRKNAGFSVTGILNRMDFDITGKISGAAIGTEVRITADIQMIQEL